LVSANIQSNVTPGTNLFASCTKLENVVLSGENRRYQRAYGAALAAVNNESSFASSAELAPVYLRLPQAERELKLKINKEK
jgi:hypothetical protein